MMLLNPIDLAELAASAMASPRKRSHRNIHISLDAAVQRLAIAMDPETYVRPHRHPQTWELYVPLSGAFKVVLFDNDATVTACYFVDVQGGSRVFELPCNTWHSVVSLEQGSVIFEIKEGPYIPPSTADLAAWSPIEGHPDVPTLQKFLLRAKPGQQYSK